MVRTHTGLDQSPNFWADKEKPEAIPHTWNVEVFVQTIKELVSFLLIVIALCLSLQRNLKVENFSRT
jgi:hypothetical protein